MPFAIFGQHVANIQLRQLQQIAQVLLVLIPIEPPHRATALSPDLGEVCSVNRFLERRHQHRPRFLGKLFPLRRHLALFDTIMNAHPAFAHPLVTQCERQGREI